MGTWLVPLLAITVLASASAPATAGDVNVGGYIRGNGTYVAPHVRSAPNNTRSDNYGRASASDRAYGVPAQQRDYDGDGLSNRFDVDDDNDGTLDDFE